MSISQWPHNEQPREKLIQKGPSSLSDAELLAIFLRVGIPGKSAVALARDLILSFGSLNAIFSANSQDFLKIKGIGIAKYAQLQAVRELARRSLGEELREQICLNSPDTVKSYLCLLLGNRPYEIFVCMYLNTQHQVIHVEELFRGTLTQASIYPREIARQALHHNAAAIIIAHNHPSGVAEPSDADRRITQEIQKALAVLQIELLDHFIIAGNRTYSFVEHGETFLS